jgi:hypothetical protein
MTVVILYRLLYSIQARDPVANAVADISKTILCGIRLSGDKDYQFVIEKYFAGPSLQF